MSQGADALRADPRRVADMFGRIAPRYDFMNRLMTAGLDSSWRGLAAAEANVPPGGRVLDACCGTGDLALKVAETSPGAVVTGIDLSEKMLELATRKAAAAGVLGEQAAAGPFFGRSSVSFRQADVLALPFGDDEFDAATVAFGVRNVPDLGAALRELARVVRQSGRLACLEIAPPPPGWGERFHRQWFDRAVPVLGKLIAGDGAAYSYLPDSVRSFPRPEALCRVLCDAGWDRIRYRRLGLGIVALHVAERASVKRGLSRGQDVPTSGERHER